MFSLRAKGLGTTLAVWAAFSLACEKPQSVPVESSSTPVEQGERQSPAAAVSDDTVVARLGERPIHLGELRGFIETARPPGFRLSAPGEATHLLRELAAQILLEESTGDAPYTGRFAAREALVRREIGEVEISSATVERYLAKQQQLQDAGMAEVSREEFGEQVREALYRRQVQRLARELLNERVAKQLSDVDLDAVSSLVRPRWEGQGPLLPPGMTAPQAGSKS